MDSIEVPVGENFNILEHEFEKDNSDSDGEGNFFTANRQIIILSILGLAIIIMLSAFAIGPSNHENSSSADSSFDDFINNNLVSSSDDSEDVEYYYTSGGYDFSRNSNNEDSKLDNKYIVAKSNKINPNIVLNTYTVDEKYLFISLFINASIILFFLNRIFSYL